MKISAQLDSRKDEFTPASSFRPGHSASSRGAGRSTLVLNAISAQRQKLLDEYNPTPAPTAPFKRKRHPTGRTAARVTASLGVPYDEGKITHISVNRTSCQVHRYVKRPNPAKSQKYGTRGKIDSFSDKSRAKLKRVAGDCFPLLISQFCLTYGSDNIPADGRETHLHLHRFLTNVTRKFKGSTYLWVLEFQSRGVPHFHVFFSFPHSTEKQNYLAKTWVRITKGSDKQLKVHLHPKNFTPWDMKKGGYLCKYLEKKEQKNVPPEFENVGRFWGCSRNIVPDPENIYFDEVSEVSLWLQDKITGEAYQVSLQKMLYRSLRKHHEATTRNVRRKLGIKGKVKSRIVKQCLSTVNLPSGGRVIKQVLDWFYRTDMKSKGLEMF